MLGSIFIKINQEMVNEFAIAILLFFIFSMFAVLLFRAFSLNTPLIIDTLAFRKEAGTLPRDFLLIDNEKKFIAISIEDVNQFVEFSKKSVELLKNNSTLTHAGAGVVGILATTLTYRMLIRTYSDAINNTGNLD